MVDVERQQAAMAQREGAAMAQRDAAQARFEVHPVQPEKELPRKVVAGQVEAQPAKAQPAEAMLLVDVRVGGEIVVDQKVLTQEQFTAHLKVIAATTPNQKVHIRGDQKVKHDEIVNIIKLCKKAGIPNISFATQVQQKK